LLFPSNAPSASVISEERDRLRSSFGRVHRGKKARKRGKSSIEQARALAQQARPGAITDEELEPREGRHRSPLLFRHQAAVPDTKSVWMRKRGRFSTTKRKGLIQIEDGQPKFEGGPDPLVALSGHQGMSASCPLMTGSGRAIHVHECQYCGDATGGVGHYIPGSGMISMISIHAPGICR
jgi:hypothetical protein